VTRAGQAAAAAAAVSVARAAFAAAWSSVTRVLEAGEEQPDEECREAMRAIERRFADVEAHLRRLAGAA
jgi:hypothetical protein